MKKLILVLLLLLSALAFNLTQTYALDNIVGPDVIYKQSNKVLTMTTIKALYSSTSGDIIVINDNFTGNGATTGIYTITFGVEGTAYEKTVDINVRQVIGDVIAVTETNEVVTIHLHKSQSLTLNQIKDILVRIQYISFNSTTEIYILTDTYSENNSSVGIYNFEFYLANASGFEETYEIFIKVNNTELLTPDILVERDSLFISFEPIFYTLLSIGALVGVTLVILKLNKRKLRKGR